MAMTEHIRCAWGTSSLGSFMAAVSERGLVAFEFGDQRDALLNALRERFPGAAIEVDRDGLTDLVSRLADLVDHPATDLGIAIDPRGSEYEKKIWNLLRAIPIGETMTYGALAAKLGTRDPRDLTQAIAANTIAILIPCHRVVKKDGKISGYRWGVWRKRALLKRERQE
jgi:AraC family transcriptional regulator of adaptative response/methylated-DNA-[protein]-cysteine methyltransferase